MPVDARALHRPAPHIRMDIVCETEGCANRGEVINFVTGIKKTDLNLFYEDYGHGACSGPDFCPRCNQLGILQDPIINRIARLKRLRRRLS